MFSSNEKTKKKKETEGTPKVRVRFLSRETVAAWPTRTPELLTTTFGGRHADINGPPHGGRRARTRARSRVADCYRGESRRTYGNIAEKITSRLGTSGRCGPQCMFITYWIVRLFAEFKRCYLINLKQFYDVESNTQISICVI